MNLNILGNLERGWGFMRKINFRYIFYKIKIVIYIYLGGFFLCKVGLVWGYLYIMYVGVWFFIMLLFELIVENIDVIILFD